MRQLWVAILAIVLASLGKTTVKDGTLDLGVAGGVAIGTSADSAIGFSDGGVLIALGADIRKKVATDMGNILTEYNNASPDRIQYWWPY